MANRFWLSFLFLTCALPAFGQKTPANPFGASLNVQDAGTCSTAGSFIWQSALSPNANTTTVTVSGTFSATLTVRESNNGGAAWTTAGTISSAGTTSYSTNGFTDFCVDVTSYSSGIANVTIFTGASGSSGGGGGAPTGPCGGALSGSFPNCTAGQPIAPNQSVIYASPSCGTQANCYSVNADVHFVSDASTSTVSQTITCPNSDCNFTGTDFLGRPIAKVGQIVWATSAGILAGGTIPTLVLSQTTISSINGANSITVGTTPSSNTTGTAWLFWGDDDTTNLSNWWTAVGCSRGVLPSGYMFVQASEFTSAPVANCSALSNSVYQAPSIEGQGITATWIIPTPNFNATTCTGGAGAFTSVCFGGPSNTDWRDLTIWGGGNPRTNSATTHYVFMLGSASRAYNIDIESWAQNETGWNCVVIYGSQDIFQLGGAFECGGKSAVYVPSSFATANPGPAEFIGNYWANTPTNTGNNSAAIDDAGPLYEIDDYSQCFGSHCAATHFIESTGNDTMIASSVISTTGVSAMRVDGVLHDHDSFIGCAQAGCTAPSGTFAIYTDSATANLTLENTVLTGGSTGGSLDFLISGAKFYNEGNVQAVGTTTITNGGNAKYFAVTSESQAGTCSSSAATVTFRGTYAIAPLILISSTTSASTGDQATSVSTTTATIHCNGASDSFTATVIPNPF